MVVKCATSTFLQEEVWERAYWASSVASSSLPVSWLEPEDASPLDSVAPPSSSSAPSLPDSPELEVSPLEELSWPAAADVPGRA
jgi:hypothetical protein